MDITLSYLGSVDMVDVCRDAACRVCQMTFFSSRLYFEIIFNDLGFSRKDNFFGINTSN